MPKTKQKKISHAAISFLAGVVLVGGFSFSVNAWAQENAVPSWVKEIGEFWVTDQIDSDGFLQVIEYLIQNKIIVVASDGAVQQNSKTVDIPSWIKTSTTFWVQGQISDNEFSKGLEWLINNRIIQVSSDSLRSEGNVIQINIADGVGAGDK